MDDNFRMFLESIAAKDQPAVLSVHEFMMDKKCKMEMKSAKSGYVLSYLRPGDTHALANFVCRKTGVKIRFYAEHVDKYENMLSELPAKMKAGIAKSSDCKRLKNPDDCNSRCPMGYIFHMDGQEYKKCRYMAFMLDVTNDNVSYLTDLIEKELEA